MGRRRYDRSASASTRQPARSTSLDTAIRRHKVRNVLPDGRVSLVVDDVLPPWQPRAIEVRGGRAEACAQPGAEAFAQPGRRRHRARRSTRRDPHPSDPHPGLRRRAAPAHGLSTGSRRTRDERMRDSCALPTRPEIGSGWRSATIPGAPRSVVDPVRNQEAPVWGSGRRGCGESGCPRQ
jgi:hypothetical protein